MAPTANNTGAFTVSLLTFRPGIRGVSRSFTLRSLIIEGRCWLVTTDTGKALGWQRGVLRSRCIACLTGDAWGYANLPGPTGSKLTTVVDAAALVQLLRDARTRQGRAFLRWLMTLKAPAT